MSGLAVVVVVVIAVVVVALLIVSFVRSRRRRAGLQAQFGSEYDRTVQDSDSRRKAERELRERTDRRDQLDIVSLSPQERDRYRAEWRMIQERFVDTPAESVAMAHALLRSAMSDRGYPDGDRADRIAVLSVDNSDVVEEYRRGVAIEQHWRDTQSVDTEDLRQAMRHFRTVFGRVVGTSTDEASESSGEGVESGQRSSSS